ncbi:MAG: threonylcarbamoyl-AMP synthase [Myxococcales bacterium]|nr:threonylcarbamoyl-AMP synthase [Myxococcales bacterium]
MARAVDLDPYLATLRAGGVVACPTETLVGLLADALDPRAVAEVLRVKGRPAAATIGLLLPSADHLSQVAPPLDARAAALAARHWPGPLTVVTWGLPGLPEAILQDGKVGVRVPGASPAAALVEAFGGPLTATSANRTGEPPASTTRELDGALREALEQTGGRVLEGDAPGGPPSTVIDVTTWPPRVLRPGALRVVVT